MKQFLNFTKRIAKKAGKITIDYAQKGFEVDLKAKNDLVTEADTAVEEYLLSEIESEFPDHAFLAEESGQQISKENSPYIWIIDPIDGTTNFSRGLDHYAISIGLFKAAETEQSKNYSYLSGEIVFGLIHAPKLDQTFYAIKDQGAYLNDQRIHVSETKKVADSMLSTGFPANQKYPNLNYFSHMLDNCRALRRYGAASLDLAYTALGIYDGYWEFGLSPWDIAAGALIVTEAGGKVTDTGGQTLDLFGKDIMATNGHIHPELKKIFSKLT